MKILPVAAAFGLACTPLAHAEADNTFNPAMSVILDGRFTAYQNNPDHYELPGFALGGEAGLAGEGFSLAHSEITASANVDDRFYGKLTLALAEHEGETEAELEEAFLETIALSGGFTLRAGRFFAASGYLNEQHDHAWDFADAPLVYGGLWGNKYIDDGVRLSWLSPTDLFVEIGAEAFNGSGFPAGGESSSGVGSAVGFFRLGGDIGDSQSWLAGLSLFSAEVTDRDAGGHDHGGGEDAVEIPSFTGESDAAGLSFIYKWAPDGNYRYSHLKLQGEFFLRREEGEVVMENSDPLESTAYRGRQRGYYLQATWQFWQEWRIGFRHDALQSDNRAADTDILAEAGLDDEGIRPRRDSIMGEWLPSEFSRVRLQYNHDQSGEDSDRQLILQYTISLGAHGAHSY